MGKSGSLKRVVEILREIFWTSRSEREAIEVQTEEHLKMARLLKEEREKINLAKILLSELEKNPDSNSEAIQTMKNQISEKVNLMNQHIYPDINQGAIPNSGIQAKNRKQFDSNGRGDK